MQKMPPNTQEIQDNQAINENEGEVEELNFEKPDFMFRPEANHDWRQRGPYLVCKGCEVEHGVWVGTEVILVGFDRQGEPLLKKRTELNMA